MKGPVILERDDGDVLRAFGATLTVKSTGAHTGGAYSVIEGLFQPQGFHPLPHVHDAHDEGFYVLDGTMEFRVGDDEHTAAAGTFLHVPGGVWHQFANAGDTAARMLIIHSPAMEGFFYELADMSTGGPPDPNALSALMRSWGMQVKTS